MKILGGLQMKHDEQMKEQSSKVQQWIQEGLELDRLCVESGHQPRFLHGIEAALERASMFAYENGVISKGRLNDIRHDLLELKPL